jgi:hypothetical protein
MYIYISENLFKCILIEIIKYYSLDKLILYQPKSNIILFFTRCVKYMFEELSFSKINKIKKRYFWSFFISVNKLFIALIFKK